MRSDHNPNSWQGSRLESMAGNDAATPQTMDGSAPEQLRIPSEDASITAVEFPGFVRNPDRAMQMLGGEKAIAEACEGGGYLKLSFRPEEPTCHPVFGDSKPTSRTLLLRVSKPSLADFQYLPVDTTYATRDYSQTPESNLPEKAEPSGAVDPLMCLPPLFARVDVPFDYDYRQYRYAGAKSLGPAPLVMISFNAVAVPEAPDILQQQQQQDEQQQQQPQDVEMGDAEQENLLRPASRRDPVEAVAALLRQRPIWSPHMLARQLPGLQLQQAIAKLCYKFQQGPWRGLLIRRGYDPRADPGSRKYQSVAYTLPGDWWEGLATKVVAAATEPGAAPAVAAGDGAPPPAAAGSGGDGNPASKTAAIVANLAAVNKFEALPTNKTVLLQLCDLEDEALQQALSEPYTPSATGTGGEPPQLPPAAASEISGWFTPDKLAELVALIVARFQDLLDKQRSAVAGPDKGPAAMSEDGAAAAAAPKRATGRATAGGVSVGGARGTTIASAAATGGTAAPAQAAAPATTTTTKGRSRKKQATPPPAAAAEPAAGSAGAEGEGGEPPAAGAGTGRGRGRRGRGASAAAGRGRGRGRGKKQQTQQGTQEEGSVPPEAAVAEEAVGQGRGPQLSDTQQKLGKLQIGGLGAAAEDVEVRDAGTAGARAPQPPPSTAAAAAGATSLLQQVAAGLSASGLLPDPDSIFEVDEYDLLEAEDEEEGAGLLVVVGGEAEEGADDVNEYDGDQDDDAAFEGAYDDEEDELGYD